MKKVGVHPILRLAPSAASFFTSSMAPAYCASKSLMPPISFAASRTVQVRVLAGFALVAFLLAAIGIHGVLSFAVSQRTAEIGVRIALGAQRRDILGMVLKQGVILVAAGLVPGLVLAYFAGRMLQSTLLGSITPADLPTFTSVVGLTLLMALGGTLLPTLRALRVDPIKAIRAE